MNDLPAFVIFGRAHIVSMIMVLLIVCAGPSLLKRFISPRGREFGRLIAGILILNEIFSLYIAVYIHDNPLSQSLPLQLCGFAALLTAWMLWRQSYRAFEIAYFWGIGGSIPAIITPDLLLGFPHPTFIHFFASHGLIMFGVIYATTIYGFRPGWWSMAKAVLASLILMLVMAPVNLLLDANYMYLCQKPVQNTLMDYFGPWPWYLVSLVCIGVMVFVLSYLPFTIIGRRTKA
jgi:hypothetical integral membrane protein (TIGR02206 family)